MDAKRETRRGNLERLNLALKGNKQTEILEATLAEAQRQGLNQVSKRAGMTRSTLHAALGPHGNPTLATILKLGDALGLVFGVVDSWPS